MADTAEMYFFIVLDVSSRLLLSGDHEEKISSRSYLVCRWSSSPCVFISSSPWMCPCPNFLLGIKNTGHTALRPILITSFNYFFIEPISKSSCTLKYWMLELQHINLMGEHYLAHKIYLDHVYFNNLIISCFPWRFLGLSLTEIVIPSSELP